MSKQSQIRSIYFPERITEAMNRIFEVHELSGERPPLPQTGGNSALMGTIGVLMVTMGIWLRRKSRN